MEKLIELLNEYEKEKTDLTFKPHLWDTYRGHLSFLEYNSKYSELLCISKKYGFIQWLVDNDKIDRKKLEKRPFSDGLVYSDSDCTVYRSDTTYEMLLMLLSISDTHIEDLISYLK